MSGATGSLAAQPETRSWARLLLLLAAIIEFLSGLGALPILAGDLNEVPGPGLGGAIILATIILHPIAAGAALLFLLRGQLPWALVAMALVILLNWVAYLPSVQLHGMDVESDPTGGLVVFLILILPPILVLAVSGLALMNTRLTLATLLAIIPTLIGVLSVVAFAIGVAIYGF